MNLKKFALKILRVVMTKSQNQLKPKNSKNLFGYLDKVIRLLVFIFLIMSTYYKTFNLRDGHEGRIRKLMPLFMDDDML